ncbi:MAG TPA: SUMF1/EgtB/PvdO family nonheme iron enzyme [Pyrinomonadaceae bacterium]|jgi:iron(II)-dependent oxidoreductase
MTATTQAKELARVMSETRAETRELFRIVRDEADLRRSPGGGFRPIIWHLAHIGVFEAYWLLQKIRGEHAPDERYERIFDPIQTPREESTNLPTRDEMEDYLTRVRERVVRVLDEMPFDDANPLLRDAYVFHLVLEHELQHQETLAYLLQLLAPATKAAPSLIATLPSHASSAAPTTNGVAKDDGAACVVSSATDEDMVAGGMVSVAAGNFQMGSVGNSFAYDNELPSHERFIQSFKIDRLPTTNEQYARFIAEGGYERREWWSDEGWTWREREGWTCPLYWRRASGISGDEDGAWRVQGMFGEATLEPQHPVTGVSWYEAEAYARFAGKRLPTEAEWEKAAAWDAEANRKRRFAWGDDEPTDAHCNFGRRFWGTTPVGSFPAGASAAGCLDMTGNVWEWTADAFRGFEGFQAFPYPEYSETWFDEDHRVLKGGSWATSTSLLRTSFRNFFRRHFRIAFAGIRLAADD